MKDEPRRFAWEEVKEINDADFESEFNSKYYIRLMVKDVAGILSHITGIYGDNGVSINSVIQKETNNGAVPIIFVTHTTKESAVQNALKAIGEIDGVEVAALIRVED